MSAAQYVIRFRFSHARLRLNGIHFINNLVAFTMNTPWPAPYILARKWRHGGMMAAPLLGSEGHLMSVHNLIT